MARRYLALWFPYPTADRWQHEHGASPGGRPRVFIERSRGTARIGALSAEADAAGLTIAMTLTDARARIPNLVAVPMDAHADDQWLAARLRDAGTFSPAVTLDPPHGLALDITGCTHLFGGERALLVQLDKVMQARGARAHVASGATPDMARALSRFGPRRLISAASGAQDGEAVRDLPIDALEAPPEATLALKRAGLRRLADLMDRPSVLFTVRFGSTLVGKLNRITGAQDRRLSPERLRPPLVFEARCPEPIARDIEIMGLLDRLIAQACEALVERGEGGRVFAAIFVRTDNTRRAIRIETGRPQRTAAVLSSLFEKKLDALADPLDPGFGFDEIRLEVRRAEAHTTTQVTLDAHHQQDDGISALLDRLAARFGRLAIHTLTPGDAHLPEKTQRAVAGGASRDGSAWPIPTRANTAGTTAHAGPSRPCRLFEPPQPIDMQRLTHTAEPERFRWRRLCHEVRRAEGPERIVAPWWTSAAPVRPRDYWRIETGDGRRYWLFREGDDAAGADADGAHDDRWFLHGVFA